MFATGSHDGAVRIWTKRPEEVDDELGMDINDAGRRAGIPRTHSPMLLEEQQRSDSPFTQQDLDSEHTLQYSHDENELPERDRSSTSNSQPEQTTTEVEVPRHQDPRVTFRERILAYAAHQRAIDAAAEAQTPGNN